MEYDFKVETRPLHFPIGEDIGTVLGKKAVINAETNEVLSIVSDRYELTYHEDVINTFDSIEEIVREDIKLSEDGGIMFAKYNLPNHGKDSHEIRIGETVKFSLRVFNSYNLMTSRGVELIAHNLICNNGMVVPKHVATISFRHMNNNGMAHLGGRIGQYTNDMADIVNVWKHWLTIKPEESKIRGFVHELPLGTEEIVDGLLNEMVTKTTLWDIYNVLTYYITHQMENRGKNKIANQRKKAYEYTDAFYNYAW
jgi:hypothetical protein